MEVESARDEESARARERWDGRERDREMREIDGTMRDDGRWKKVKKGWLRENVGWSGNPTRSQ